MNKTTPALMAGLMIAALVVALPAPVAAGSCASSGGPSPNCTFTCVSGSGTSVGASSQSGGYVQGGASCPSSVASCQGSGSCSGTGPVEAASGAGYCSGYSSNRDGDVGCSGGSNSGGGHKLVDLRKMVKFWSLFHLDLLQNVNLVEGANWNWNFVALQPQTQSNWETDGSAADSPLPWGTTLSKGDCSAIMGQWATDAGIGKSVAIIHVSQDPTLIAQSFVWTPDTGCSAVKVTCTPQVTPLGEEGTFCITV
jgi:hypothetical protein